MPSTEEYLTRLEEKPLASSIDALKHSRSALEKLDSPDKFSTDSIEGDLIKASPELYAFLFKQAGIAAGENLAESLEAAIAKLGFQRLKKLIYFHIAYSGEISQHATALDREFAARLWALNYRIASTAHHWASQTIADKADDLFYLSMLQNLGVSAFAQLEPSRHRALRESKRAVPLAEKEKEHLGLSHYELGIAIVEKWGLPPAHAAAMKFEETHGQGASGFADPDHEDLFTLLYAAKYRAENKKYQQRDATAEKLGIDPHFNYNRLLLQIAADQIRRAAAA